MRRLIRQLRDLWRHHQQRQHTLRQAAAILGRCDECGAVVDPSTGFCWACDLDRRSF